MDVESEISVLQTETLTTQATRSLRRLLVEGVLTPGTKLGEAWVAERLGISRAPVREAFRVLAHEGLLEVVSHKGTVVRRLNSLDVAENYEVRTAIESYAAYLAASRANTTELEQLEQIVKCGYRQSKTAQALDQASDTNDDFHLSLVLAAHNSELANQFRTVNNRLKLARLRSGNAIPRAAEADDEHRNIVEMIRRHDSRSAENAMRIHIRHSYAHAVQVLKLNVINAPS